MPPGDPNGERPGDGWWARQSRGRKVALSVVAVLFACNVVGSLGDDVDAGGVASPPAAEPAALVGPAPAAAPGPDPVLDSLRARNAARAAAEEDAAYADARALPASELERNRDAYANLARRYPTSDRAGEYAEKRDAYAQRVVDRDNARFQIPAVAAAPARGCCKRCSTGKPCGDSCISRSKTCNKGPGCAC